jgi:hypothetical protein
VDASGCVCVCVCVRRGGGGRCWPHDFCGKRVLELGCGVGLGGLAAGARA